MTICHAVKKIWSTHKHWARVKGERRPYYSQVLTRHYRVFISKEHPPCSGANTIAGGVGGGGGVKRWTRRSVCMVIEQGKKSPQTLPHLERAVICSRWGAQSGNDTNAAVDYCWESDIKGEQCGKVLTTNPSIHYYIHPLLYSSIITSIHYYIHSLLHPFI